MDATLIRESPQVFAKQGWAKPLALWALMSVVASKSARQKLIGARCGGVWYGQMQSYLKVIRVSRRLRQETKRMFQNGKMGKGAYLI